MFITTFSLWYNCYWGKSNLRRYIICLLTRKPARGQHWPSHLRRATPCNLDPDLGWHWQTIDLSYLVCFLRTPTIIQNQIHKATQTPKSLWIAKYIFSVLKNCVISDWVKGINKAKYLGCDLELKLGLQSTMPLDDLGIFKISYGKKRLLKFVEQLVVIMHLNSCSESV